jgi:hypothetical protein
MSWEYPALWVPVDCEINSAIIGLVLSTAGDPIDWARERAKCMQFDPAQAVKFHRSIQNIVLQMNLVSDRWPVDVNKFWQLKRKLGSKNDVPCNDL